MITDFYPTKNTQQAKCEDMCTIVDASISYGMPWDTFFSREYYSRASDDEATAEVRKDPFIRPNVL